MCWCRIKSKSSLLIQATLLVTAVLNRAAVGASSMSGGKSFQSLTVLVEKAVLVCLSRSSHLEESLRVSMSRCSGLLGDIGWEGYSNVTLD